jgi:hypothetical protein
LKQLTQIFHRADRDDGDAAIRRGGEGLTINLERGGQLVVGGKVLREFRAHLAVVGAGVAVFRAVIGADGHVGVPVVAVDGVDGRAGGVVGPVLGGGDAGEHAGLAEIGESVEDGKGTDVVDVTVHVGVEDDVGGGAAEGDGEEGEDEEDRQED